MRKRQEKMEGHDFDPKERLGELRIWMKKAEAEKVRDKFLEDNSDATNVDVIYEQVALTLLSNEMIAIAKLYHDKAEPFPREYYKQRPGALTFTLAHSLWSTLKRRRLKKH